MTAILAAVRGFFGDPLIWIKLAAGVIVVGAVGFFIWHYKDISDKAASVPGLQNQISQLQTLHAHDDADAAKAALQIIANQAAAAQSAQDFNRWNEVKGTLSTTIKGLTENAPATKNPDCLPTTDARKLWNSTIDRLTAK